MSMSALVSNRSLLASCLIASLFYHCAGARLLPYSSALHDTRGLPVQLIPPSGIRPSQNGANSAAEPEVDLPPEQLALCDCERAVGAPHGLACDKEGWFIAGFERKGSWLIGGGLVPLSHALCCRPCLPVGPPEGSARGFGVNDSALAIVSLGCHASAATGPDMLSCGAGGGGLAVGWTQAIQVAQGLDAFYPVGAVECCTPALLLQSGDAWELERCDCVPSDDVSCGGQGTGRLLQGFDHWRLTFDTDFVPVAPATCCKACLSQTVHPIAACTDRNMCSGRGVCILGQCECLGGWQGADCSVGPAGGGDLPQWAIALIIMGSCITLAVLMVAGAKTMQYLNLIQNSDDEESEEDADNEESLLVRLGEDDRGSVGSEDTSDCDSDTELAITNAAVTASDTWYAQASDGDQVTTDGTIPTRHTLGGIIPTSERHALLRESIAAAVAAAVERNAGDMVDASASDPSPPALTESNGHAEQGSAGSTGQEGSASQAMRLTGSPPADPGVSPAPNSLRSPTAVAASSVVSEDRDAGNAAAVQVPALRVEPVGEALEGVHGLPLSAEQQDGPPGELQAPAGTIEGVEAKPLDEGKVSGSRQRGSTDTATGPLSSVACSVCMSRYVQVVLIPCGHACMCRRCSRRLDRCPVCRKDIFRRQRLFVGG